MADFQYLAPNGVPQPGSPQPNGGVQQIPFRSLQDAQLSGMGGFIPSEEYPSGYLGTIQSRREDRFLDNLKDVLNKRSYTRGVHKGERIDPGDYFWPPELGAQRGLIRQSKGRPQPDGTVSEQRFAPLGTPLEQMTASNARELPVGPRGRMMPPPPPGDVNPAIAANLQSLAPSWR